MFCQQTVKSSIHDLFSMRFMQNERPIDMALRLALARGWNQTAFAAEIGATSAVVSNWKKRGMPADQHSTVAAALGISVDQLLGGAVVSGSPPPLPPRDFNDRQAVSESDWGVLQDVRLVMSDEQLQELRNQAERIRRIAREQMASVSSAGSENL